MSPSLLSLMLCSIKKQIKAIQKVLLPMTDVDHRAAAD